MQLFKYSIVYIEEDTNSSASNISSETHAIPFPNAPLTPDTYNPLLLNYVYGDATAQELQNQAFDIKCGFEIGVGFFKPITVIKTLNIGYNANYCPRVQLGRFDKSVTNPRKEYRDWLIYMLTVFTPL